MDGAGTVATRVVQHHTAPSCCYLQPRHVTSIRSRRRGHSGEDLRRHRDRKNWWRGDACGDGRAGTAPRASEAGGGWRATHGRARRRAAEHVALVGALSLLPSALRSGLLRECASTRGRKVRSDVPPQLCECAGVRGKPHSGGARPPDSRTAPLRHRLPEVIYRSLRRSPCRLSRHAFCRLLSAVGRHRPRASVGRAHHARRCRSGSHGRH